MINDGSLSVCVYVCMHVDLCVYVRIVISVIIVMRSLCNEVFEVDWVFGQVSEGYADKQKHREAGREVKRRADKAREAHTPRHRQKQKQCRQDEQTEAERQQHPVLLSDCCGFNCALISG